TIATICAGLVVSLYCGAINQLLVIFHHDQLQSMFLWSTGTLTQTDWGGVERLWPQLLGGVLLLMAVVVALSFGRDAHGWTWASGALLEDLMPWRWPRIMAALFAGVMLAVAGCIIQRLTGNPMASPEVLGISSGAAFGVVLMLFLVPGNAFGWLLP
ncbi:iron chelate uptake ABC transporter family permease subunit, partial [Pseudomonas aeruginosa]|uniref:iron chelate uptake ABC transporter family permease subunit n=1 Tax=Pseudomonas aeruginosa TaxID=287 RepID=UPI0031B7893E